MYKIKNCPICNSSDLSVVKTNINAFIKNRLSSNIEDVLLYTCCKHSFGFFNYRFTDEEMGKLYKDYRSEKYQIEREQYDAYYTKEFQDIFKSACEIKQRRNLLHDFLFFNLTEREFLNIHNILDYGGGNGELIPEQFTQHMAKSCFVYDLSDNDVIKDVVKLSSYECCKTYSYDLILCSHVLEHIPNLVGFLSDLKTLCNKKTIVYFEVPIESTVEKELHEHINFFSAKALEDLLVINGFKVKAIDKNRDGNICCLTTMG